MHECIRKLHFKPQHNVFYEWYVFNSCEQNKGESIDNYITCLQKLALSCEFGTVTDELICDRLVIGLVDIHECCFAFSRGWNYSFLVYFLLFGSFLELLLSLIATRFTFRQASGVDFYWLELLAGYFIRTHNINGFVSRAYTHVRDFFQRSFPFVPVHW